MALPVHKAIKDSTAHTVKVTQACHRDKPESRNGNLQYKITFYFSPPDFEDINECSIQGVCQNGQCLNTLGSFKCSCKVGLVLDRNRCVGTYLVFHIRHNRCTPKWNPVVSSVRVWGSSRAGRMLPDSVWEQGMQAWAAHLSHQGDVLLHGGKSLGTQLWTVSSGGHRWVNRDRGADVVMVTSRVSLFFMFQILKFLTVFK